MPKRFVAGLAALAGLSLGWPAVAAAQTAAAPGLILPAIRFSDTAGVDQGRHIGPPRPRRRWAVELHGGLVGGTSEPNGFGSPPSPAAPFAAANQLESAAVSSYFFGDGAKVVNAAVTTFAAEDKIAPIDTFLAEGVTTRTRGGYGGGRIAYALSSRVDVEFTVDRGVGDYGLDTSATTGLQAAATSFKSAWTDLLGALPASVVTAQLSGTISPGSETFSTVGVNIFSHNGRFAPYVTAGLGVLANSGSVSATLNGNIQFAGNGVSKSQTDAVAIAFSEAHLEPVYVLGLGFLAEATPRSGVRLDLRFYISGNPDRTVVSTAPTTSGTGTVDDLVTPYGQVYQFSGLPNVASTLSVPLANVQTFTATGLRKQMALAFGYYFRF